MTDHTTPPTNAPPPAAPPVSSEDLAKALAMLGAIHRRVIRTETRVMRLLDAQGLDAHGQPILPSPPEKP